MGDYTYKLAKALLELDIEVGVLCSNHPYIQEKIEFYRNEKISVYPILETWSEKGLKDIEPFLLSDQFDFISLQFVPFAFQSKGLPLGMAKALSSLFPKTQWHIMFHELWLGMERNAKITSKVHGLLQKSIINNIIKKLNPRIITTNSHVYQYQLNNLGYSAEVLPLFSNIPKNSSIKENSGKKLVFSFFGSIHYGAPIQTFLKELLEFASDQEKLIDDLRFKFIGNCGSHVKEWLVALDNFNIAYQITGKISEEEVSNHLSGSDYGITTTPYMLTEKSGTIAAMLQHNLKVICVARPWEVNGFNSGKLWFQGGLQQYKNGNLNTILSQNFEGNYHDVKKIAATYLNYLNQKN